MSRPEVVVSRGAPEDDEIAAVIAALWLVGVPQARPASTPLRPGWTSRTYRMPGTWAAGTRQPVNRR